MKKMMALLVACLWLGAGLTMAAPAPAKTAATPTITTATPVAVATSATTSELQKIRLSQSAEKVRLVIECNSLPPYTVTMKKDDTDTAQHLIVKLPATVNRSEQSELSIDDPVIKGVRIVAGTDGALTATIDLKTAVVYKVFTLTGPNRLVIDIIKNYDQKLQNQIQPGLVYTSWLRGRAAGPVAAHILDIDLSAGFMVEPLVSNDKVPKLEALSGIVQRAGAIAGVNSSYFALNGDLLGVTKIDGTVVSSLDIARSAIGFTKEGKPLIDEVSYQGTVTLPAGQKVDINGVNCERGADSLILYNRYYDQSTGTNEYGIEYVIVDNRVSAINPHDSVIPANGVVLSAHGTAAQALHSLAVGDTVTVTQSLGERWDKAWQVVEAGPRLLKDGSVYLTGQREQFPADITVGRAPRTAIGTTKNGHLLMVVVDGRQKHSIGFSLTELALFMQELGAVDAINLDGGGSSEMVVQGDVVNKPSDGRERSIGAGLGVIKQTLAK